MIPAEFAKTCEIETAPFLEALDLVAVPLADSAGTVALQFTKHQLTLHTESPAVGEGTDTLAATYGYDDDLELRFNPRFLREPLRASGTEKKHPARQ